MKALTVKCVIRYLKKNEKNYLYQVYYRITKNRRSEYLPSELMVGAADWNEDTGRYKEIYRTNAKKILTHKNNNKKLEEGINDIKLNISEISTSTPITAAKVKQTIISKAKEGSKNVNEFFNDIINDLEKEGKIGNRRTYISARNKFEEFSGKDVTFTEMTEELLKEYIKFLKKDGLVNNSIFFYVKTLRALYNRAIEKKVASKKQYLEAFENIRVNGFSEKTKHRTLSNDEITKLKEYKASNDNEKFALSVFFFSYFNGGISIKDIAKLKKENIIGGVITYTRTKTGDPHIFTLHKESGAIIESQKNSSDYLFPILEACDDSNEKKVYHRISRVTNIVNKTLRGIGIELKLSIPLTTYVARHSYATRLLRGGASIEQISQALNHKDKNTTKIYLDRFASDEIAKLGDLL